MALDPVGGHSGGRRLRAVAALYEDASDEPLNDAANDVEHLN